MQRTCSHGETGKVIKLCAIVCVLRVLMATGRALVEIISMQSVFESRASTLKTTSGSPDWVIERMIMSSMETRLAEGALSSRWGETPSRGVRGTEHGGHSPGSWEK